MIRGGLLLALLALGLAAYQARRQMIRRFFVDGRGGSSPVLTAAPAGAPGLAPVAQVRVLLIDGLGETFADRLPALRQLCGAGRSLRVDVGFPTVSLPVQAVLWTGRTQSQSGLMYRVTALPRAPDGAAPARVPGSVAVVEEQAYIASSFGFARTLTEPRPMFPIAALAAVAEETPLVFVHALQVDKAGHKHGAGSPAYAQAAADADALLARLLAVAPPSPDRRWLVLSDHGQRPGGGHGGEEPSIRLVRACLAGGPPSAELSPGAPAPLVHLVDVSRALFDSLGLTPPAGAPGRPLAFATLHPDPGATLPRVPPLRAALAALVALALLVASALALRRSGAHPRWWLACWLSLGLALASAIVWRGWPSLSNPMIYPPQGRDMMLAASPGLLMLAVFTAMATRAKPALAAALVATPVALVLAPALGTLVACGGLAALWGRGDPPLLPVFTGQASFWLAVTAALGPTLAMAVLVGWVARHFAGTGASGRPPA